jgi:hypothetical protein
MTRMNLETLNLVENSLISKTLVTTLALILHKIALTLCPWSNLFISPELRGLGLIKFDYVTPVGPSATIKLSELFSYNNDEDPFCWELVPSLEILILAMRWSMLFVPSGYTPPV